MTTVFHSDVLIVGAGPAGAYLGWKLAAAGCDVQILEAQPLAEVGTHIDVIHLDQIRFDEFEIPHPQPPEMLHLVPGPKVWSVDFSTYYQEDYPVYVTSMPLYLRRQYGYIRDVGGKLIEQARVDGVIVEDGYVKGVRGSIRGERFEAYAKITVDASGIVGAVRTRLPAEMGIETTPVPAEQTFYCALELRDQIPAGFPVDNNSFLGAPGFWNKSYGDGVILGIIAPGSAENAWEAHRQWRETYYGDPGRLVAKKTGCAPFRRAPASYVANGFAAVGDCVFQNKAFSGEGITSGYTAGKIAKEVILDALRKEDFSREALWDYNLRYFRGQGAKFAGVMGFYPLVSGLPRPDVDFLYQNQIIFSAADASYLDRNYELNLPPERWVSICAVLEKGVAEGKFSSASYQLMNTLYGFSAQLKTHHLTYPETPHGLPAWSEITRSMWGY